MSFKGEPYGRHFSVGTPTSLYSVTNGSLAGGANTFLTPVSQSPVAGYAPVQLYIGYEVSVQVQVSTNSGVTVPFVFILLTWFNDDSASALPVRSISWYVPAQSQGVTLYPQYGGGPNSGQFLKVQMVNKDPSVSVNYTFLMRGTSRQYIRDDWRWQPGGNAGVPTYTLPVTTPGRGTLMLCSVNQSVAVATPATFLIPLFAGHVILEAQCSGINADTARVYVSVINSAVAGNLIWKSQPMGNASTLAQTTISLPRDLCLLTLDDTGGSGAATFIVTIIAEEY